MDDQDRAALQRALVQHLDGFVRAGLTHWNVAIPAIAAPSVPTPTASARPVPPPLERPVAPRPAAAAPAVPMPRSNPNPPPRNAAPVSSAPAPRPEFQPLELPREERITRLNVLAERVKNCTRCEELARTRTQTVFGVGNPEAKILFVGEAPGADEDQQGEPFVGRAGQLLNDIIKACRLKREDIYICNVLRCRPPGNRLPSPEEAGHCREYLDGQIAIVNPDYIVCWGSTAAKNLLASDLPIGKMRGKFYEYGRAKVLCTYHPSYLLRNPAAKKDVWEDMKTLFHDMGIDLSAK